MSASASSRTSRSTSDASASHSWTSARPRVCTATRTARAANAATCGAARAWKRVGKVTLNVTEGHGRPWKAHLPRSKPDQGSVRGRDGRGIAAARHLPCEVVQAQVGGQRERHGRSKKRSRKVTEGQWKINGRSSGRSRKVERKIKWKVTEGGRLRASPAPRASRAERGAAAAVGARWRSCSVPRLARYPRAPASKVMEGQWKANRRPIEGQSKVR